MCLFFQINLTFMHWVLKYHALVGILLDMMAKVRLFGNLLGVKLLQDQYLSHTCCKNGVDVCGPVAIPSRREALS